MTDDDSEPGSDRTRPDDLATLSEREREVLALALSGLPARDLARVLSLTEATVRSHLSRIYAKLGVAGRVELLASMRGSAAPAGQPFASVPGPQARPGRPGRPRAPIVALAAIALIVGVVAAVAVLRPDLPARTDLATAARLVGGDGVAQLDLQGETLTIVMTDGQRYRVERVTEPALEPLRIATIARSIPVGLSGAQDTPGASLAMLARLLIPIAAALVVVVGFARTIARGPGRPTTG